MNNRLMGLFATAVASISLLIPLVSCRAVHELQRHDPTSITIIASLLKERDVAMKALQDAPFTEPNTGVLGSYLAKIRSDGMSKNAEMKQRLDALSMNTASLARTG